MSVVFASSSPLGKKAPISVSAAWVTNDKANHRIGLIAIPQLVKDAQRSIHVRLQHTAFEYKSLDELLETYVRLKKAGIAPLLSADHGPTTSMYYEDPDGNSVELFVDNFGIGRSPAISWRILQNLPPYQWAPMSIRKRFYWHVRQALRTPIFIAADTSENSLLTSRSILAS
jgi:hypothetical protein